MGDITGRATLPILEPDADIPDMAILAWLFVRGAESIRIVRDPAAFVLRVEGPGYEREVHAFKDEAELGEFQRTFEARLLAEAWLLAASQERRSGRDRRSSPRGGDRRRG